MFSIAFITALTLGGLRTLTMAGPIAQQIAPNFSPPDGYLPGFATQDQEPLNQQSACTIGGGVCTAPTPLYPSTSGPAQLPDGVYAAAIVGLGPTDCTVCGTCYSLISSGTPYCDPNGPPCNVPSGPEVQTGPSSIKVLITNHCPDCTMINVDGQVQGHFDINNAAASGVGWNNPKIYYKQLANSDCM